MRTTGSSINEGWTLTQRWALIAIILAWDSMLIRVPLSHASTVQFTGKVTIKFTRVASDLHTCGEAPTRECFYSTRTCGLLASTREYEYYEWHGYEYMASGPDSMPKLHVSTSTYKYIVCAAMVSMPVFVCSPRLRSSPAI